MIHKVTAMMVRKNLGELLNGVQYRHDTVLITKTGKPVAALVDIELFEKIRRMKQLFNRLSDELANAYKGSEIKNAEADIKEALNTVRNNEVSD